MKKMTTTGIMQSICARGGRHERPFFLTLTRHISSSKKNLMQHTDLLWSLGGIFLAKKWKHLKMSLQCTAKQSIVSA